MDFRILGPLAAYADDGTEIPLGGPKQRAVLALLLTNAGRVIDTDRLVEELWPDATHDAPRKTVQAYVSRLRGVLRKHGGPDIVHARPTGYRLDESGHRVDAREFERALANARAIAASDPDEASRVLDGALREWRGRPFEDAYLTAELELEAARLEEQHLAAEEVRAEAEVTAGRHREVIGELRRLTDEHPLREHLWALLLLALYRSGRQGEALGTYVEVARRLSDELGVEPSSELAELQRRMLQQDPELDGPARIGWQLPLRLQRGRARHWFLATTVAVVVVATALASGLLFRPAHSDLVVPRTEARYPVPQRATEIVAAAGRVWVLDPTEATLTAVATEEGDTDRFDLPAVPSALAAGMGYLWVASELSGSLTKIDPRNGRVLGTVEGLELRGAALASGPDAVWVIREHVMPFLKIDPDDMGVGILWFRDGFGGPVAPRVTVHHERLWGSNAYIGRILSLDPEEPGSETFAGDPRIAEHFARSILADGDGIWFSQPTNGSVTRVAAATGAVTGIIEMGRRRAASLGRIVAPYALAAGPGGIWVALPDDGKVALLDDDRGAVRVEIGFRRPTSIAASVGTVWVLDAGTHELVQLLPGTCRAITFIGPGADLRGCDLSGKVFVGLDLTGADLRWADLSFAAAQHADLTRADLFGADLTGAALDDITWGATRCPDGTLSDQHAGTCGLVRDP